MGETVVGNEARALRALAGAGAAEDEDYCYVGGGEGGRGGGRGRIGDGGLDGGGRGRGRVGGFGVGGHVCGGWEVFVSEDVCLLLMWFLVVGLFVSVGVGIGRKGKVMSL